METLPGIIYGKKFYRSFEKPYQVRRTGGGLGHGGFRAELRHDGGHSDLVRVGLTGNLKEEAAMTTHKLQTEQTGVGPVSQTKIHLNHHLSNSDEHKRQIFVRLTPCHILFVNFAYLQTDEASSTLHQI